MRHAFAHYLLSVVLLSATSLCAGQTPPENLDFEHSRPGDVPPGWVVPTTDYRVVVTEQNPAQGRFCAELASGDKQTSPFGNLMRTIDAEPYRGKRVRLRAAVRVEAEGVTDRAQLWFRVDRPDKRMGFFDNMSNRPIREGTWDHYEITGDVAPDAVKLNFGLMLLTRGKAWLDDVTLEIVAEAASQPADPPRKLDEHGLVSLVAFTRLLGYVRYFHPSDAARDADWPALAIAGVTKVEAARDAADLARILTELFQPVAPTVCIYAGKERPPLPPALSRPSDVENLRVAYWEHVGVGLEQRSVYGSTRRVVELADAQLPAGVADPAKPFEANLGAGVTCLVPLALWADGEHTLPYTSPQLTQPASAPASYSGNERATRLADVALAWNVFQHFYPYFDVVEIDWLAELRKALTAAATDKDERAFLDTLRVLVAALHDGHGGVNHNSDPRGAALPLAWDWIEDRLVVTAVQEKSGDTPALGLKPGDVIEEIDAKPAAAAIAEIEERTSAATPQFRRWKALNTLCWRSSDNAVILTVRTSPTETREATVRPAGLSEPICERRPEKIAEVRPGVFYIDMERVTDADFQAALPQLEKATGIVLDFRGYPSHISPQAFFPHLTQTPLVSPQWHIPVVTRPDQRDLTFRRGGEWNLSPSPPYLAARRAFIIDGRAVSYAESCLGIVEHYKLGELVGGPTAGTNGNINPFTLPGGYNVMWTGMKVLKQDGRRHHGVGIRPTIPVARTIEGVRAGRDELLERAIAAVSEPASTQPAP
jgi:hypothetical protein